MLIFTVLHYCIKSDCLYSLSDLDTLFKEIKCIFCYIQEISHYLKNLLKFKKFTLVKPPQLTSTAIPIQQKGITIELQGGQTC